MTTNVINRREFLKLGVLSLSSLALGQSFGQEDAPLPDLLGRVTIEEIDVYTQPRSDTSLIVGKHYRDQLIALYYSLTAPDGPAYNPIWYRLWGGYTYSGYIQLVKVRTKLFLNPPQNTWDSCKPAVRRMDISCRAFPGRAFSSTRRELPFMELSGITILACR